MGTTTAIRPSTAAAATPAALWNITPATPCSRSTTTVWVGTTATVQRSNRSRTGLLRRQCARWHADGAWKLEAQTLAKDITFVDGDKSVGQRRHIKIRSNGCCLPLRCCNAQMVRSRPHRGNARQLKSRLAERNQGRLLL